MAIQEMRERFQPPSTERMDVAHRFGSGGVMCPHILTHETAEVARCLIASKALQSRAVIRGGHCGQRSCELRKQAEHMAATDQLHREENSCQQEAVRTWPKAE